MKDPKNRLTSSPIPVDAPSEVIEIFLDTLTTEKELADGLKLPVAMHLLRLSDLYDSERCRVRLKRLVEYGVEHDSMMDFWTGFAIASRVNDPELACYIMTKYYPTSDTRGALGYVDPVWLAAAMLSYKVSRSSAVTQRTACS